MAEFEKHHSSLHFFVGKCQVLRLFSVMGRKRQVSEASEQNVKPDRPLGSSKDFQGPSDKVNNFT